MNNYDYENHKENERVHTSLSILDRDNYDWLRDKYRYFVNKMKSLWLKNPIYIEYLSIN